MTKEELRQESFNWTEKNISVGISMYNPSIETYCAKAYEDSAEPREKRIAELENANEMQALRIKERDELLADVKKENAELKREVEKHKWENIFLEESAVYDKEIAEEYTTLQERIKRLEKENLVLHEMNVKRLDLQKENAELRAKLSDVIDCFISASSGDDFEMAESAREVMEVLDITCYRHKEEREKSKLAIAKEHIENLLYYVKQCSCERSNYAELEHDITEAEQFISEVGK